MSAKLKKNYSLGHDHKKNNNKRRRWRHTLPEKTRASGVRACVRRASGVAIDLVVCMHACDERSLRATLRNVWMAANIYYATLWLCKGVCVHHLVIVGGCVLLFAIRVFMYGHTRRTHANHTPTRRDDRMVFACVWVSELFFSSALRTVPNNNYSITPCTVGATNPGALPTTVTTSK